MEGFFTFIFFAIVSVYVLGLAGKWLLRRWLVRKQKELFEQFSGTGAGFAGRGAGDSGRRPGRKREGEVRIEDLSGGRKRVRGDVGEYVDFEEID